MAENTTDERDRLTSRTTDYCESNEVDVTHEEHNFERIFASLFSSGIFVIETRGIHFLITKNSTPFGADLTQISTRNKRFITNSGLFKFT